MFSLLWAWNNCLTSRWFETPWRPCDVVVLASHDTLERGQCAFILTYTNGWSWLRMMLSTNKKFRTVKANGTKECFHRHRGRHFIASDLYRIIYCVTPTWETYTSISTNNGIFSKTRWMRDTMLLFIAVIIPLKIFHKTSSRESYELNFVNPMFYVVVIYVTAWALWWYTVRRRYNAFNFHPNHHKRHPLSRPWGRDMRCLLWI